MVLLAKQNLEMHFTWAFHITETRCKPERREKVKEKETKADVVIKLLNGTVKSGNFVTFFAQNIYFHKIS